MLRSTVSRLRAARSTVAHAAIFCCSTMSRTRHQPPGHTLGIVVCGAYSGRLRGPPRNWSGCRNIGVARRALADSVSMPAMLWNGVIQWKPMCPHPE